MPLPQGELINEEARHRYNDNTGIKKIFQRNNRNVKVTITDNYKLILKNQ